MYINDVKENQQETFIIIMKGSSETIRDTPLYFFL